MPINLSPLFSTALGWTIVIDGITYRPALIDSSGRVIIVGTGADGAVIVSATDLDIRNLTKALDELYAVLRTDAGVAYDARNRNWTITETVPVQWTDFIPTSVIGARRIIDVAGTPEQLPNIACKAIDIAALPTNTGLIYVGDSTVSAVLSRRLSAGDSISFAIDNLNRVWLDASVSGEGVSFLYVN